MIEREGKYYPSNAADKLPEDFQKTADKLPVSEQERQIYKFVLENGAITTAQAMVLLGVKQRRARDILVKMIKNKWLTVVHQSPFMLYFYWQNRRPPMEHQTGIRDIVLTELRTLARTYELDKLILFGSRARGDYRRTSDIDLAATGGDVLRFSLDADEETSTLLSFDVVNLDRAVPEELRESIEKEGIVLYEKT